MEEQGFYRGQKLQASQRTGALESISQILRKELSRLRGFSATQLREMRLFYEAWMFLDPNSSVVADEFEKQNSTSEIARLQGHKIDIYQANKIPKTKDFSVEDFFKVPFTHHTLIRAKAKSLEARYYYIHHAAEVNIQKRVLEKFLVNDTVR